MDTSLVEKALVFKSAWTIHRRCTCRQVLSLFPFKPCDPSLLANRANHALPGLSRAVPLWFLGALRGWPHQWGLYFNSCLQQRKHEKALFLIHACFCDQWILHSQEVQASTGLRRHWPLCLRRLSSFMAWIAQYQAFTTSWWVPSPATVAEALVWIVNLYSKTRIFDPGLFLCGQKIKMGYQNCVDV